MATFVVNEILSGEIALAVPTRLYSIFFTDKDRYVDNKGIDSV